jgi:hypothetical protein
VLPMGRGQAFSSRELSCPVGNSGSVSVSPLEKYFGITLSH